MLTFLNIKKLLIILLYTTISYIFVSYSYGYFTQSNTQVSNQDEEIPFRSAPRGKLGQVSVALCSNIGIRYTERNLGGNSVINVVHISDAFGNESLMNNSIIIGNMQFIQEYLNLLKTDVLGLLDNSHNRETTLTNFIKQLEEKYRTSSTQVQTLTDQRTELETIMQQKTTNIESLKLKISTDFSAFRGDKTSDNIYEYLNLKDDHIYARTYLIFINKFIEQYVFLNDYNKKLLDTLINNKSALVSKAFVVIPDSGDDLLKQMKLLFDEADYKSQSTGSLSQ